MATITTDTYDVALCVYLVENTVNGKRYVGQTVRTLRRRWSSHLCSGLNGRSVLRQAIDKYGDDAFVLSVLEVCSSPADLDEAERRWIKKLGTICPDGYNLTTGGQSSFEVTDATRQTMSRVHRGSRRSPASTEKAKRTLSETVARRNADRVAAGIPVNAQERSRRKRGIEPRGMKQRGSVRSESRKLAQSLIMMRGRVIECSNGKTYSSMREAVADTGVDRSRISRVAKGERKSAGGFMFRYVGGAPSLL